MCLCIITESSCLQENRSTWSSAWSRTKSLFPFLWPRNSWLLQLRVLICIGLLIGGRVLNVYVPVYQKRIGNVSAH